MNLLEQPLPENLPRPFQVDAAGDLQRLFESRTRLLSSELSDCRTACAFLTPSRRKRLPLNKTFRAPSRSSASTNPMASVWHQQVGDFTDRNVVGVAQGTHELRPAPWALPRLFQQGQLPHVRPKLGLMLQSRGRVLQNNGTRDAQYGDAWLSKLESVAEPPVSAEELVAQRWY